MAITFQRAPTVSVGDPPRSRDYNKLAQAWNDRITSGVADCAWRIAYYFWTAFKAIRNPADQFTAPAQDEWFKAYSHFPFNDLVDWPDASAGQPEGLNLANPVAAFVFGNPNLYAEDVRTLNVPLPFRDSTDPPWTARDLWGYGKLQRGFRDPSTGDMSDGAYVAALSHYAISPNHRSKMLMSYGGFSPAPLVDGDCGDASSAQAATPKYDIFFTPLTEGLPVKSYTGICPPGSSGAQETNAIAGIVSGPIHYRVFKWDGTVDELARSDYVLGPFEGYGSLQHQPSLFIDQMLNKFALEFRGSESERDDAGYDAKDYAAQWQRFFTSQYLLAPMRGETSGSQIIEDTPTFEFSGNGVAGDKATNVDTAGTTHDVADGFVISAVYVEAPATGITGRAKFTVKSGDTGITSFDVENGEQIIRILETPATEQITVELDDTLTMSGTITIELLEQLEYKPGIHDAYLLMRLGSCKSALSSGNDYAGVDFPSPRRITEEYFANGLINNQGSAGIRPQDYINRNPVYEAGRRLADDYFRMVPKEQLLAYEVVDGKSILYFKRYALGLSQDVDADSFREMVSSITSTAPAQGYSNEWVCFFSWMHYHPSESSVWKEDAFANVVGFLGDPCRFYEQGMTDEQRAHFAYGQRTVLWSENPTGYRYASGSNNPVVTPSAERFFKACRIYEPPLQIESVEDNGNDEVKVTLTGRLRHHENAPDEIGKIPDGYGTVLNGQDYATDEGRLMAYLRLKYGDETHPQNLISGDTAADAAYIVPFLADNPYQPIMPRFYAVKLIPKVYEDDNDDINRDVDTKLTVDPFVQMELYARPMIEGWMDTDSSLLQQCEQDAARLYDYTFESAVTKARGTFQWFSTLPSAIRSDKPRGFGPFPNTQLYADVFNQFSQFINLMTRARIDLPLELEQRKVITTGLEIITPDSGDADLGTWPGYEQFGRLGSASGLRSTYWALWNGKAPEDGETYEAFDWEPFTPGSNQISGSRLSKIHDYAIGGATDWRWLAYGLNAVAQFRVAQDQSAIYALPDALRDTALESAGILGKLLEYTEAHDYTLTPGDSSNNPVCSGIAWPGSDVRFDEGGDSSTSCAVLLSNSSVEAPELPSSMGHGAHVYSTGYCLYGGGQSGATFVPIGGIGDGNVFVDIATTE